MTGKFLTNPSPLPLSAAIGLVGLVGPDASEISRAIGFGVGAHLNSSGLYRGSSTGAVGVDTSKVVFTNGATLTSLLTSTLASNLIFGPVAPQLAAGVSSGIVAMILKGGGSGASVGPTGPFPGIGVSRSGLY